MKKYAVLHEPGDIVTLAGTRFVVLDVERRGSLPDSLFLLALESVGASEFGSSNNYAESDLKKAVDKWLEDMGKRGLDNAKLIPREIDLTTLDGSGCYGKLSVKTAPLTLDSKVSIATLARTAALAFALANQVSSAAGKPLLPIESSEVEQFVTTGLTIATSVAAWWKNNSFTPAAIEGDKRMNSLKNQVH